MAKTVIQPRTALLREGVGVVKVSTWDVGSPEGQRAAVDAIGTAWLAREWPEAGPLAYSVYVGEDGRTLLHYSQWRDEGAHQAFFRQGRDERNAEIDAAVPGVRRVGIHAYERYRSMVTEGDDRLPGCVAVIEVDFDGADPGRLREWVDAVFAAFEVEPGAADGSLSAHFHVGVDGTRALNFAEWTDAASHLAMLNAPEDGEPSPAWQRVHTFPGLKGSRIRRYAPALGLSAGAQRGEEGAATTA
ncbi:antibiotic biosynthesis monooxygenase [Streptomyces sp. NPDC051561]|uniref:antibiotic biosynthesis monooxygenase n=1 Tax=Streptomyces sp. NPDC051561 TaxID=3365658 RepID=UPI0037BC0842